jgi:hypothetical protein
MRGSNRFAFRLVLLCAICIAAAGAAGAAEIPLTGRVVDENAAPVAGASVTLRTAPPGLGGPWSAQTDPAGLFKLKPPATGDYLIDVERAGYYKLTGRAVRIEGPQEITLVINRVREVFQSVNVGEQPSPVDITETPSEERLTGTEVNDLPYQNSHSLRSAMKIMPGVVEDAGGGMHFNGSSEDQVLYTLNGFDIADPYSRQFHTSPAVEGIHSLDYAGGRYSPELGNGSAGALNISTENGTDAFHYTSTDFIPGVQVQQGLRLGNWYPRAGISGPIRRGRAWFSDNFNFQYNTALITSLPSGQDTRTAWSGSNLLHTQFNLNPRNIVYADFFVMIDNQNRLGLGPLDPVSTTQTVRSRQYFGSVKDQVYLAGSLVEFGYAHNEFVESQTPQGSAPYVFSPMGRSGNYFLRSHRTVASDELEIHGYARQFHFAGTHQVEAGAGAEFPRFSGLNQRTSYELVGLSGQIISETSFTGAGAVHARDSEISTWAMDKWSLSKRVQLNAGIREDWDRLVDSLGWSPRISISWSPFAAGRTRVAAGYTVAHDAIPLEPFGRALDQTALTTTFGANGLPAGPPVTSTFTIGPNLAMPRAATWSLGVDHKISSNVYAGVDFLRRRYSDGLAFLNTLAPSGPPTLLPLPNGAAAGAYQLVNLRRDRFDSVRFSVHQTLHGQYEWMATYTRSSARSNAFLDLGAAQPLAILSDFVPMPWDAPNRFLAWAYLPLPWKDWAITSLVDARTGFPFSVQEQTGVISGQPDSLRYPFNFDLNLGIERMVTFRGRRFALRLGADNLTNSRNPGGVNNVIGSPQYLQFVGDEGRHFVARIRFFGRATKK